MCKSDCKSRALCEIFYFVWIMKCSYVALALLPVMVKFLFNNSLIEAIKNFTTDNLIIGSIIDTNANK